LILFLRDLVQQLLSKLRVRPVLNPDRNNQPYVLVRGWWGFRTPPILFEFVSGCGEKFGELEATFCKFGNLLLDTGDTALGCRKRRFRLGKFLFKLRRR